jgi:hypothetical protein
VARLKFIILPARNTSSGLRDGSIDDFDVLFQEIVMDDFGRSMFVDFQREFTPGGVLPPFRRRYQRYTVTPHQVAREESLSRLFEAGKISTETFRRSMKFD